MLQGIIFLPGTSSGAVKELPVPARLWSVFRLSGDFLACIAGLVGVILTKYLPVGAVMIPAVFLFPAFGIYGAEAGIIAAVLALLMLIRHYPGLKNIPTGTEPQIDLLKRLRRGK